MEKIRQIQCLISIRLGAYCNLLAAISIYNLQGGGRRVKLIVLLVPRELRERNLIVENLSAVKFHSETFKY